MQHKAISSHHPPMPCSPAQRAESGLTAVRLGARSNYVRAAVGADRSEMLARQPYTQASGQMWVGTTAWEGQPKPSRLSVTRLEWNVIRQRIELRQGVRWKGNIVGHIKIQDVLAVHKHYLTAL